MTKDDMIGWCKSAPWARVMSACYGRLGRSRTSLGDPEGGAYQMLLVALIEDERRLDPRGSAHELRRDKRRYECRGSV